MTRLIIAIVLAGLIAAGYLLYSEFGSGNNSVTGSSSTSERFQNATEAIEGAGNAVQQTQDLQNKINSSAQDQLNQ